MTIDERARQAARDLNQAVAQADLMLLEAGVPGEREVAQRVNRRSRSLVFAGGFAVVLLVVAIALVPGRVYSPDAPETNDPVANSTPILTPDDGTPDSTPSDTAPAVDDPDTTDPTIDLSAPELTISFPEDGAVFEGADDRAITFRGTVDPGSEVIAAGLYNATVNPNGTWFISLIIGPGDNVTSFVAVDEDGLETEKTITVTYIPDQPEVTSTTEVPGEEPGGDGGPADTPDADVTFSASAIYKESAESPPFDVYEGTATPGATISVTSEYGNDTTVADEDGQWRIRVVFNEAPPGETFLVTVRDELTERELKFGFTNLNES